MKTKKKVVELIKPEEAVSVMRQYAEATSKLKQIEADIELAKQAIVDRHKDTITQLQGDANEASEKLIKYAEFNSKQLFVDGKTVDLQHGFLILRTATPRVDKIRSLSWNEAIEILKEKLPAFVRRKDEVNKDAIIGMRDDERVMAKLNKIGITVVQDETITVKTKEEVLVDA